MGAMTERWFERPWQKTQSGTKSVAAAAGYFVAGLCGVVLALWSDGSFRQFGWAAFGLCFIGLGVSLAVTLYRRERPDH